MQPVGQPASIGLTALLGCRHEQQNHKAVLTKASLVMPGREAAAQPEKTVTVRVMLHQPWM